MLCVLGRLNLDTMTLNIESAREYTLDEVPISGIAQVKCFNLMYMAKNAQPVDENSLEQCCAHIVQCCQQYCSALLSLN